MGRNTTTKGAETVLVVCKTMDNEPDLVFPANCFAEGLGVDVPRRGYRGNCRSLRGVAVGPRERQRHRGVDGQAQ